MKSFLLSLLLASVALAQTRSFYTDRPDVFGSDISIGAGGTSAAPTRTANTAKSFTLSAPAYSASTGRGTFPAIYFTDDGTDRSLYLGRSTGGLTDFRVYTSTYGSPTSGNTAFSIASTGIARFEYAAVFVGVPRPSADNTVDLGSSSFSWKDGWFDGDLNVGSGGKMQFQSRTRLESGSDGVLSIRNAAAGNMTRVLFGTADSSGPALSFSGTTVQATDGVGGLTAFSANTIELGHASDTTIARSAAGVVTIEGLTVLDYSGTPTTGQIPVFTNGVWNVMTPGSSGIGGSTGSVDNRVLRADGTGGSTVQNSAVFIDDFTSSTANNVAIRVDDGTTANISAVITPKGTGAFIVGPKPDGTGTGGNARGQYAVDVQPWRDFAGAVASGNSSVAVGTRNTASALYSVAIGYNCWGAAQGAVAVGEGNTASGLNSFASGSTSTASGAYSFAHGFFAQAPNRGQFSISGGNGGSSGGSQSCIATVYRNTTATTQVVLATDGSSGTLALPNNTAWTFEAKVTGITSAAATVYSYILTGVITRGANAASTAMPAAVTKVVVFESNAAADADAVADTTNGALSIRVTPFDTTATRWSATVQFNQVTF